MIMPMSQSDVADQINVSDPDAVANQVCNILGTRYPGFDEQPIRQGFADMHAICTGHYPTLLCCDTPYHNLTHFLDTTLLMARLIDGYERAHHAVQPLGASQCSVAILLALFHDIGLFRHPSESHLHGADLLAVHEQRGVDWVQNYLSRGALASYAAQASLIFATELTRPVKNSLANLKPNLLTLAQMLGTADLMSQFSGRYYLENCRDSLYQELQLAQADGAPSGHGEAPKVYATPFDLLRQTPAFYAQVVAPRLEQDFAGVYRYEAIHFGGDTPYERGMRHNLHYLQQMIELNDLSALRRKPVFIKGKARRLSGPSYMVAV